jgi:hypothetical protein
LDEEKKVMLEEMAMQPDFVRANVDTMLEAMRSSLILDERLASGSASAVATATAPRSPHAAS